MPLLNIKGLVTKGCKLDKKVKENSKELDRIKKRLKSYAKQRNKRVLMGQGVNMATLSDSTGTEVDMVVLWEIIDGDFEKFVALCKGNVTSIRKECDIDDVENVLNEIDKPFNRISFS